MNASKIYSKARGLDKKLGAQEVKEKGEVSEKKAHLYSSWYMHPETGEFLEKLAEDKLEAEKLLQELALSCTNVSVVIRTAAKIKTLEEVITYARRNTGQ